MKTHTHTYFLPLHFLPFFSVSFRLVIFFRLSAVSTQRPQYSGAVDLSNRTVLGIRCSVFSLLQRWTLVIYCDVELVMFYRFYRCKCCRPLFFFSVFKLFHFIDSSSRHMCVMYKVLHSSFLSIIYDLWLFGWLSYFLSLHLLSKVFPFIFVLLGNYWWLAFFRCLFFPHCRGFSSILLRTHRNWRPIWVSYLLPINSFHA